MDLFTKCPHTKKKKEKKKEKKNYTHIHFKRKRYVTMYKKVFNKFEGLIMKGKISRENADIETSQRNYWPKQGIL